jgi:tRNA (guanine-N7-)-methyltransferase
MRWSIPLRVRFHANALSITHKQPIEIPPLSHLFADVNRPLLVDLGCARGNYHSQLAEHGACNVLGVELRRNIVDDASVSTPCTAILYANLLHDAHRDAIFARIADAPHLDAILCLFPDPFFKHGHRRRRVFAAPLLDAMPMRPFHLVFKSDVLELFLEARQLVAERPHQFEILAPPDKDNAIDRILGQTLTSREKFVIQNHMPVFSFVARRIIDRAAEGEIGKDVRS